MTGNADLIAQARGWHWRPLEDDDLPYELLRSLADALEAAEDEDARKNHTAVSADHAKLIAQARQDAALKAMSQHQWERQEGSALAALAAALEAAAGRAEAAEAQLAEVRRELKRIVEESVGEAEGWREVARLRRIASDAWVATKTPNELAALAGVAPPEEQT